MHPEFQLSNDIVHLNHAAVGPWPRRTVQAITRFAYENMNLGSQHYLRWQRTEQELRVLLQWLINAPSSDDIALLKNTSEGLSVIAYGIDWQPGDNIICARQEFPSNRVVWESLRDRFDIDVRLADLDAAESPEDALLNLVDERTRLLAVSAVQYATGLRMDLGKLGEFCRTQQILFCVDAIQQLGALPFDAQAVHADFVVADSHKWMLAPEGVALFYCRAELREKLRLTQYGWHMLQDLGNYDRLDWKPAATARRFECGSANTLGQYALHASLTLIKETGLQQIDESISRNIEYLIDKLENMGCLINTPKVRQQRAGILSFKHPALDSHALYQQLQSRGILCAARGGGVRFSPHFHTTRDDLDRTLQHLENIIAAGRN